jgi:hypothetical protein
MHARRTQIHVADLGDDGAVTEELAVHAFYGEVRRLERIKTNETEPL